MKRPLLILLIGLFLAVVSGVYLPLDGAKPVHALNTACNVGSDSDDVLYPDWHASTSVQVSDSYPSGNPTHQIFIDLWSWRYSSYHGDPRGFDHCYRTYYGSAWSGDGSGGYWTGSIRAWDCGAGAWPSKNGPIWSTRNDAIMDTPWAGSPFWLNVPLPSGQTRQLYFADYGSWQDGSLCLPQADTDSMRAASDTWTPSVILSSSSSQWYCHDRNANFFCP